LTDHTNSKTDDLRTKTWTYWYASLFHLRNLNYSNEKTAVLREDAPRIELSSAPDTLCQLLDRAVAARMTLLKGAIGSKPDEDAEVDAIRRERREQNKSGTFMLVSFAGETTLDWNQTWRSQGQTVWGFDLLDAQAIRTRHQSALAGCVAAASLMSDEPGEVRRLESAVYAVAPDGTLAYSFTITANAPTIRIGPVLDRAGLQRFDELLTAAMRHGRPTPLRLAAAASDESTDDLRRFMAAWNGLEALVQSSFTTYRVAFYERFTTETQSQIVKDHFDSVENVMKSRYRSVDKFRVMAAVLMPPLEALADVRAFAGLKRTRDELMHGTLRDVSNVVVAEARRLLHKYLRLDLGNA
jgi:hypothetical protein